MEQGPNLAGHPSEGLVRRKENVSAAINLIPTQCSPGMKTPDSYDHRNVPSIISGRPFWYFPANGLQLAQRAALANDASFQAEIFRRVKLPGFVLRGLARAQMQVVTRVEVYTGSNAGSWLQG